MITALITGGRITGICCLTQKKLRREAEVLEEEEEEAVTSGDRIERRPW